MKKNICVITGSRAEYGVLRPLINEIKASKNFNLQLVVTGMHLSPYFGYTYKEIEKDGFKINYKINISLGSDTAQGISRSMGLAMIGFGKAFNKLGAFDDAFRHSITKMSYFHFTSTEEYRKRVIQLGEDPARVFNVGAIGLDNIKSIKLLSKLELEKKIKFKFNKKNLLITFHPVTLEQDTAKTQVKEILSVLSGLKGTNLIFTKANADRGGRVINRMIDAFVKKNKNATVFGSMGQLLYLSTMKYVDAVVGNSSSGIVEAPSFKIGTINIGDRQTGRIKAASVIDATPDKKSLLTALTKLYSRSFQKDLGSVVNPHGNGQTAKKIIGIFKNINYKTSIKKKFHDL
ncbi:MAG: UDP-N-acetylglucosamine 2-epimerase [Proteobacteria bacterium]|nr:UDP-N-acetylglucosamine 2-epimerase [Pseudomonadota bacterium]